MTALEILDDAKRWACHDCVLSCDCFERNLWDKIRILEEGGDKELVDEINKDILRRFIRCNCIRRLDIGKGEKLE